MQIIVNIETHDIFIILLIISTIVSAQYLHHYLQLSISIPTYRTFKSPIIILRYLMFQAVAAPTSPRLLPEIKVSIGRNTQEYSGLSTRRKCHDNQQIIQSDSKLFRCPGSNIRSSIYRFVSIHCIQQFLHAVILSMSLQIETSIKYCISGLYYSIVLQYCNAVLYYSIALQYCIAVL